MVICGDKEMKIIGDMERNESNIIIYNTIDGKASVVLYARDGSVWMKNAINRSLWDKNQNQLAELFDTSK